MSASYELDLIALRLEIEQGGARPSEIDKLVTSLLATGGANLPSDLLKLLSDKAAYDEGMFTLIHSAESVDDATYVRSLLCIFPSLADTSPRWASIILMRVMNSDATRHELVHQLREAPMPVKESVRVMCKRINEVSPAFLSKTVPVTLAATCLNFFLIPIIP